MSVFSFEISIGFVTRLRTHYELQQFYNTKQSQMYLLWHLNLSDYNRFLRNSGISTCNGRIAIVIAINTVNGKHKGFECDTERVSFTMLRILIAVQAL